MDLLQDNINQWTILLLLNLMEQLLQKLEFLTKLSNNNKSQVQESDWSQSTKALTINKETKNNKKL